MADTKITALTALTGADPANDVIPIVDVSDTTMAASGTTKKISVNNILGASGTATLASATITGDLTVDTSTLKVDSVNDRVGIKNAAPSFPLDLTGTGSNTPFRLLSGSGTSIRYDSTRNVGGLNRNWILGCDETAEGSFALLPSTTLGGSTFTNPVYRVTAAGVHTFFDGAGGTYATLNSTGLGVGTAPDNRLVVSTAAANDGIVLKQGSITVARFGIVNPGVSNVPYIGTVANNDFYFITNNVERMRLDATGNVGIGVTPSYKLHVNGRVSYSTGIGEGADLTLSSTGTQVQHGISSTWTSQNFYTGGTSRVVMKQNGQVRFVPLASDPAGAEAGDVYYNSTSNKLKCYNGTTWNDLF